MNTCISQRERFYSQTQAADVISIELKNLGWVSKESSHGKFYPTVYCELFNASGAPLQDGMGKGEGLQAKLSARFEALEHSITDLSQKMVAGIWKGSLQNAISMNFGLIPTAIPKTSLPGVDSQTGYWKIFSSSKHQGIFIYPLSKLDPFSDYLNLYEDDQLYRTLVDSKIPWLKNNNGTAIGASEDDAFLHAYHEVIERYSLASLYVDAFLKDHPRAIKLIRKNSLPIDISNILEKIELENNVILSIIDMTSELGVPSFAVTTVTQELQNIAIGYGTSLYADYALQRALLECQQLLHTQSHPTYGPVNLRERETVESQLSSWPKLQTAVRLDLNKCQIDHTDFAMTSQIVTSVSTQRKYLEELFRNHEIEVFSTITYKSKATSICSVRVLVPDFSDFSFIEAGLPVTPSGRVLRRFFEDL